MRPKRIAIAPGDAATLTVTGRVLHGASPGDHASLLLLLSRPLARGTVAVRMRLGIVVVLRVPGHVVHRLALLGVRAQRAGRRRLLTFRVANRGNVAELLGGDGSAVTLWRGGRLLTRLRVAPRELLPRSRGVVELAYRGPLRGLVFCRIGNHSLGPPYRMRL